MKLLYQFSATDSFVHKLDPRTKLLFVAVWLVATFLFPWPWAMGLLMILTIWGLARISPRDYYPFLLFLLPIMVAVTIVHLFIGEGPYWEVLGFLKLSQPGLISGVTTACRLATMGITFIMFSMTTDPFDWGLAMHRAGLPYRVAFMFAFAMRFFPLLQEEMLVIRNALRARGYTVQTYNPVAFIQGLGVSVVPLGLNALRRSQDIALAMELRGFSFPETTGVKRVIFRDVRLRPRDWMVMAFALLILAAAIYYKVAVAKGGRG